MRGARVLSGLAAADLRAASAPLNGRHASASVVSPAMGMLMLNASGVASNLYRAAGSLLPDVVMCQTLMQERNDTLAVTNSKSNAASYLDPSSIGHIIGLALSNAPQGTVESTLKRCGVTTNHVKGAWTGVSLARFKRIIDLIRQPSPLSLCVPLVTRVLADRVQSRNDISEYYKALKEHIPDLFQEAELEKKLQNENRFGAALLLSNTSIIDACRRVIADSSDLSAWEIVAYAVSSAHQFKPAVALRRHGFQTGKPVPDCVEVTVREFIEHLLYVHENDSFDLARLNGLLHGRKGGANPELARFLQAHRSMEEHKRSEAFFLLCQCLPACLYISNTKEVVLDGDAQLPVATYELEPTLSNLLAAVGVLLRGEAFASLADFVQTWNTANPSLPVHASEGREVVKSLVSEEAVRKEWLTVHLASSPIGLRIVMDPAHRLATVEHQRRFEAGWVREAADLLMEEWTRPNRNKHVGLMLLRSLVVGQGRLLSEARDDGQVLEAVFSTRWGGRAWDRWTPLTQQSSTSGMGLTEFEKGARASEEATLALTKLSSIPQDWARDLLRYVLSETPLMDSVQLGRALRQSDFPLEYRADQRGTEDVLQLRSTPSWTWWIKNPSLLRLSRLMRWKMS